MTYPCQITGENTAWPDSRILFLLAGFVTLTSAVLSAAFSSWLLLLAASVGINQLLLVATGTCPASVLIGRIKDREATGRDPLKSSTDHQIPGREPACAN